jgi:hypothetical protein
MRFKVLTPVPLKIAVSLDEALFFPYGGYFTSDHRGRGGYGMNCLLSLERWDRGFASHSKHGCLCAFICLCCSVCG